MHDTARDAASVSKDARARLPRLRRQVALQRDDEDDDFIYPTIHYQPARVFAMMHAFVSQYTVPSTATAVSSFASCALTAPAGAGDHDGAARRAPALATAMRLSDGEESKRVSRRESLSFAVAAAAAAAAAANRAPAVAQESKQTASKREARSTYGPRILNFYGRLDKLKAAVEKRSWSEVEAFVAPEEGSLRQDRRTFDLFASGCYRKFSTPRVGGPCAPRALCTTNRRLTSGDHARAYE